MKSPGKLKIDVQSSAHCANNKTVTNLTSTVGSTSAVSSTVYRTPNSIRKTRNGTFHSFPIVNTPTPPSRLRKIVNPFEVGITERLHLPLIERYFLYRFSFCINYKRKKNIIRFLSENYSALRYFIDRPHRNCVPLNWNLNGRSTKCHH